jgi:hypothetical protein
MAETDTPAGPDSASWLSRLLDLVADLRTVSLPHGGQPGLGRGGHGRHGILPSWG